MVHFVNQSKKVLLFQSLLLRLVLQLLQQTKLDQLLMMVLLQQMLLEEFHRIPTYGVRVAKLPKPLLG